MYTFPPKPEACLPPGYSLLALGSYTVCAPFKSADIFVRFNVLIVVVWIQEVLLLYDESLDWSKVDGDTMLYRVKLRNDVRHIQR